MKRLAGILVFLTVLVAGIAGVFIWLPKFLEEPSVVRLPQGASGPGRGAASDLPVSVRTFKASRIEFTDILPVMGSVRGTREVDLKFETDGTIREMNFREGDLVAKGDTLAALDDREARLRVDYADSKVETALAQLRLAEQRLSVNEDLFSIGAIIEAKLREAEIEAEQAETQVVTARRERALAANELGKLVLRAPMDGVIGTREAEVGEVVNPQKIVATLIEISQVDVELGIIERDIERIRLGQRVKVQVDSLPATPFEGRIDNLAPLIEGKSRTLTAKVRVANPRGQLLPGMFARAEIAVFEKPDTLVVPVAALRDADSDGKFDSVFAVENDTAWAKPITLGYVTTDYAEILEGVQEGNQVVTEARGELSDGAPVSLIEVEEAGIERAEPGSPSETRDGGER